MFVVWEDGTFFFEWWKEKTRISKKSRVNLLDSPFIFLLEKKSDFIQESVKEKGMRTCVE